jgi:hypothetical protein
LDEVGLLFCWRRGFFGLVVEVVADGEGEVSCGFGVDGGFMGGVEIGFGLGEVFL